MCHSKHDSTGEHDIHFSVHVNCELNKCHGYTTIVNDRLDTTTTTVVNAPIHSLNQITTISTPHLMTVNATTIITSKQMVKRSGVGQSSISKRHISSNPSTASVQSYSTVLQSNQHMNFYDVEITATTSDSIITTVRPKSDEIQRYSNRRQFPTPSYQLEKTKRRG